MQGKYTPLHRAASYGHSESVQLLLAAKGNVNAENMVSELPPANMMELCGAELCGLDWCRRRKPHCTRLLQEETVSRCSYSSLRRAMLMLRIR